MSIPRVTPITGLSQAHGWSQVITHPSKTLTCVLSVAGKNANSVGKTLAEHIAHFPITHSSALHNSLLDLLQTARGENCRVQLACLLITENKNILATHEGVVFLHRAHRVGEILTSEGELKIIEGSRVEGDVFVLATHQAANAFPELKNTLHRETEDIVPQLVTQLHSKENSALSALAWVEMDPAEEMAGTMGVASGANVTSSSPTSPGIAGIVKNTLPRLLRKNPLIFLKKGLRSAYGMVKRLRQGESRLVQASQQRNTRFFFLGAGVVILVLVSAILWKRHQIAQEIEAVQPRFGELQQQLAQARELADEQPIAARAQTREVMHGLEDLITAHPDKPGAVKKLKEEYQLAQAFADSISGSQEQGTLEPFFDLRLADADFVARTITANSTHLFALDASGQRLISLDTETKQTTVIPLENIGTARAITANEQAVVVLADGLHAYEPDDADSHETLKDQGDSDRDGTLLGSFTSYLYVLNPQSRNIFRYLQQTSGDLSEPIGWLVDKQGLDFSALESMTIDGDLWLATNDGTIYQYTQGRSQNFSVGEMSTPFDSSLQLATHPDTDNLFVLEKAKNRLVVLKKDGSFFQEIISTSLGSAQSLTASLTENAVFVVSGSLVYKISL